MDPVLSLSVATVYVLSSPSTQANIVPREPHRVRFVTELKITTGQHQKFEIRNSHSENPPTRQYGFGCFHVQPIGAAEHFMLHFSGKLWG